MFIWIYCFKFQESKVLNLRIHGSLSGDGGGFDYDRNLYYLSLHTLDSDSGVAYAQGRVSRDLLDSWLAKRISFDGHKYEDSDVNLTELDRG